MTILASLLVFATPPVAFATPPWADDDPRRLELAQRLEDDHLARRIEQAVQRLDLSALWQSYAGAGSLPYRPDLLLRAVLTGDHMLIRAVAAEAVTRYAGFEPGRAVAGVYYLYRTLRQLDLDALLERLLASADSVLYDHLAPEALLDLASLDE